MTVQGLSWDPLPIVLEKPFPRSLVTCQWLHFGSSGASLLWLQCCGFISDKPWAPPRTNSPPPWTSHLLLLPQQWEPLLKLSSVGTRVTNVALREAWGITIASSSPPGLLLISQHCRQ